MNILVLGSGGREHALAWKFHQSEHCSRLLVAPGNAGTSSVAENVAINVDDFEGIRNFVVNNDIGLLVVGPEAPLVDGIREYLLADERLSHLKVVGPDSQGAQLEGSKDFAKRFMRRHGIPTADSQTFTRQTLDDARSYIKTATLPIVLKADGLAAGKGVIICKSHTEADETICQMLAEGLFGKASETVVVESFLSGIELSVFVLSDGKDYKILPEAKDYKPIGENNTGPNTGGMGSVSPVSFAHGSFLDKVEKRVVIPTIKGLQKDGIDYRGFIFIGLMNVGGDPYVIEYNVRMGDPETQVVMPRIKSDLVELLVAAADGTLAHIEMQIDEQTATTVVMVAGGYPAAYAKGAIVRGLGDQVENAFVFHAGTKAHNNEIVTNGGRVLAATGLGSSINEALERSYKLTEKIHWKDVYFRKDIGQDLIALE
jgi:phosphoribosylamine--glycine ligase